MTPKMTPKKKKEHVVFIIISYSKKKTENEDAKIKTADDAARTTQSERH